MKVLPEGRQGAGVKGRRGTKLNDPAGISFKHLLCLHLGEAVALDSECVLCLKAWILHGHCS
jgi:hypothetical protein